MSLEQAARRKHPADAALDEPAARPSEDAGLRVGQLKNVMVLRVVLVTTLLLIATAVDAVSETPGPNPLYVLIGGTYALTLVYAVALRRWGATQPLVFAQLFADLAIITGLVYLTGGERTRVGFAVLYPLSVLSGSVLLYRRAGIVMALVATALFAGTLVCVHTRLIPPAGLIDVPGLPAKSLLFSVLLLAVACHAVALTGSYLAENLRRTGRQLHEATDRLADLEELNRLIVESMQSGLAIVDAEGRIQFLNRFGAGILGLRPGEASARLVRDVLGGDLETTTLRMRAQRRDLARLEFELPRPDGNVLVIGVAVSSLVAGAGPAGGFLLVFQDLTAVKRLESEVRTKERLAAVGEVAAQLAHEIRNPLGSISGSAQLLLAGAASDLSADQLHLLEIVKKESSRLSENLSQFLLQARVAPRPLSPVDLGPVVEEAVALLRNATELTPAHTLTVAIAPGSHVCLADPDRIRQLFWNLTRNALEAMPDGGLLGVSLASRHDSVELIVRDQGRGMDAGPARLAFSPLYTRPGRGPVGLGLAIVYQIVREHRGDISFERAPPHGTSVKVVLPRVSDELSDGVPA